MSQELKLSESLMERIERESRESNAENFKEENRNIKKSLRSLWRLLRRDHGGDIYKTPAGTFRVQESEDGTLERLTRLDEE